MAAPVVGPNLVTILSTPSGILALKKEEEKMACVYIYMS
jgi:hypothetical protein